MNRWLKILEAFRDGKFPEYYYGLTPRFIIGGCQIPIGKKFDSPQEAYSATENMFREMKDYNHNNTIVVNNDCGIHNGPVMSLSTSIWSENSISTTFDQLWDRYGEEIIEGNYHINNFELQVLNEIFNN